MRDETRIRFNLVMYRCSLTLDEVNDWTAYCYASETYASLLKEEALRDSLKFSLGAGTQSQHERQVVYLAVCERIEGLHQELFGIAKAWHEKLLKTLDDKLASEAKRL